MFKSNRLFLSVFFFIFSNVLFGQQLLAKSVEPTIDVAQDILSEKELDKIISQFNDADLGDYEDSEDSGSVEHYKNPSDMAEMLPEHLKEKIFNAWEVSGSVAGKMMNPEFFQDPMLPVLELCNFLKTNVMQQEFVDIIIQVDVFLGSQKFISAMRYNFFGEKIKIELLEKLNLLEENLVSFKDSLDIKLYENLLILKDIIFAFKNDNMELFFESIEKYSSLQRLHAVVLFNDAVKELDNFLETEENEDVKKAAFFFKEKIFADLSPLINTVIDEHGNVDQLALSFIREHGEAGEHLVKILRTTQKISDKALKISPAVLFSYGFYRKVLNYYLMDNGYSFKLFFADSAFSSLFLPFYILKKVSEIKKMVGVASKEEIASVATNAMSEISEFYHDPNFLVKKSKWPMRSVYRIGSSLAYYNLWYRNHIFDNISFLNTRLTPHDRVNNFNDMENPNYRYWPKEFKHLKKSIWFSLKDGYSSLGNFAESQIHSRVDDKLLSKIENNSLGLIKPELITFGLNTAMPLLACKYFPKSIANLDKESVFAKEKPWFFNPDGKIYNRVIRPLDFGFGYLTGSDSVYYVGNRNYDKISDAQYIEGRALGYLSVTLGKYFGKKLSLKFNKQLGFLSGKLIIKLGERFKLFDFDEAIEDLEENGFDFEDSSQNKKKMILLNKSLKDSLAYLLVATSVDSFKDEDDSSVDDSENEESDGVSVQLKFIKKMLFSILVESKTFTQEDLAEFEIEMKNGVITPEQLDAFSQKILDALRGGIVQKVGGFVGGISSWFVTDMLVKKHTAQSPIYKQVLNRFSNEFDFGFTV